MTDRFNTVAGWVLFAGIVALGASLVTGEVFHQERPETMGYPIEGVVVEGEGGAEADKPIAFYLAIADAAKGEAVFKKCAACHNNAKGGPAGIGPNLYGIVGKTHAQAPGFAYSEVLGAMKGKPWSWEEMSKWLANPKGYAPGTKMAFAGISKPEDRAAVIVYLNSKSDSPLPLPAVPAEDAAPDAVEATPGAEAPAAVTPTVTEAAPAAAPAA